MRRAVIGFATGSLFSIGLMVSRMADPAKVLNFLNITQNWDPSLALVMAGGVLVATLGFALARRWQHPWFDRNFRRFLCRHLMPPALFYPQHTTHHCR